MAVGFNSTFKGLTNFSLINMKKKTTLGHVDVNSVINTIHDLKQQDVKSGVNESGSGRSPVVGCYEKW